ncbi:hypothetical protein [Pedosphaera parvula]|nr:hypothetical protein [Pedosphaera parvula]
MTGTLSLTNYSRDGKVLTNYQGTFELIRYDQAWLITTKYLSPGAVEECVFDGTNLYCLLRNAPALTNFGRVSLPPPPAGIVTATISDQMQPGAAGFFPRTVWLGAVAGDLGTDRWKKPVILPWSVSLPGGVQYFGAHPEEKEMPLANMEFKVIKESRESRVGSTVLSVPGMQFELPLGMKVGRLEALTWTNIGTMTVPTSWLVTRLSPGSSEVIQERYLGQGKIVSLDPSPIKAPASGEVIGVTDLRIKVKDIIIPVGYMLTNQPWPPKDDPHLTEQAKGKAPNYLDEVRNFSKAMQTSGNAGQSK